MENTEITSVLVNREEFELKLKEFYEGSNKGNRKMWDRNHFQYVLNILLQCGEPNVKRTYFHYHYDKLYELVTIGSEVKIIERRKLGSESMIYMLPYEDYFDKLLETHIQTGHGGRDRMFFYAQKKWRITRPACQLFASMCRTCTRKRVVPHKGVVIKPIISDGFNARGQVDLIDFQSCPDGEYKFLMNYQDHATKFVQLRPLKSKRADDVAQELYKIFHIFGAPYILQR